MLLYWVNLFMSKYRTFQNRTETFRWILNFAIMMRRIMVHLFSYLFIYIFHCIDWEFVDTYTILSILDELRLTLPTLLFCRCLSLLMLELALDVYESLFCISIPTDGKSVVSVAEVVVEKHWDTDEVDIVDEDGLTDTVSIRVFNVEDPCLDSLCFAAVSLLLISEYFHNRTMIAVFKIRTNSGGTVAYNKVLRVILRLNAATESALGMHCV